MCDKEDGDLVAVTLYGGRVTDAGEETQAKAEAEKQPVVTELSQGMAELKVEEGPGSDGCGFSARKGKEKYGRMFNKTSVKDVVAQGTALAGEGDTEEVDTDEVLLTAVVGGWVKTGRVQGGGAFAFIELNDGSTPLNLQVMVTKEAAESSGVELKAIATTGCSLVAEGELKRTPKGVKQRVELKCAKVVYSGSCDGSVYPIAKKKTTFEFLRSQLHLRARTNTISAIARVRNALSLATHLFFQENDFFYVHTPIIGTSDAEGAGEAFQVTTLPVAADALIKDQKLLNDEELAGLESASSAKGSEVKEAKDALKGAKDALKEDPENEALKADVKDKDAVVKAKVEELMASKEAVEKAKHRRQCPDGFLRTKDGVIDYKKDFFGLKSFLCVSGQLQGEAYACAMSKIYTFGPTFRAENSHTTRHAAEFWMIEPEIAFADLADVMNLAEDYVKFCCQYLLDKCNDDMQFFNRMVDKKCLQRVQSVATSSFARCTYTEAIEILEKEAKRRKGKKKFVNPVFWGCDLASEHERFLAEEHFKCPTILYNYPKEIKAFYMKLNDDGKTVAAMDVLVPGVGELVGGSQREENYDVLSKKMEDAGLNMEEYGWYMDLRKYGTVPHGGFGLGFERLIMFTTGVENIRETIPFPRWPGNAYG
ncbi:asparagine--tRNA ligase [Chloropicon primus]|uniref:asparagine--tRNA ligase n=2 Tax=Chloropicon primus TaxID=1764295 RepID=A0A5B8MYC4_9CHLO|nr:asparagine--tRNA ligase [Chloropicon primus]|eukprot:QDZ25788.1 asparagine--tRNA ligase [Chloropicon primus]